MRRAGTTETCIGISILGLLAVIAGTVFFLQSRYDPLLFTSLMKEDKTHVKNSLPAPSTAPAPAFLPESLVPMGPEEKFDSETLSDKIDGKAELYLSSGFVGMTSSRFARKSDPNNWLELFAYDMGNPTNAFSVYSLQRRKEATNLDLGVSAYKTEDAVFFMNGSRYYEIISSTSGLEDEMLALAKNIAEADPQQKTESPETAWFPTEGMEPGSISLHMSDVFGFSELDRVYTATYGSAEKQVTAFVSKRENPDAAAALSDAYCRFLIENGGKDLGEVQGVPGSKFFQVYDTYEVVLHKGAFMAGTHEVEDSESAADIAGRIYRKLSETANE